MTSPVKSKQIIDAHFQTFFIQFSYFLMFLNIQIYLIILNTYDKQFTLTTKKSLHIIFKHLPYLPQTSLCLIPSISASLSVSSKCPNQFHLPYPITNSLEPQQLCTSLSSLQSKPPHEKNYVVTTLFFLCYLFFMFDTFINRWQHPSSFTLLACKFFLFNFPFMFSLSLHNKCTYHKTYGIAKLYYICKCNKWKSTVFSSFFELFTPCRLCKIFTAVKTTRERILNSLNSTQRASMDAGVKTPQCPHLSSHYFISIL